MLMRLTAGAIATSAYRTEGWILYKDTKTCPVGVYKCYHQN